MQTSLQHEPAGRAVPGMLQATPPISDANPVSIGSVPTAALNKWSYQNMRRLWPTAPVRPTRQPKKMPWLENKSIKNLQVSRPDGSKADFDTFLQETFTDSFLVVQRDSVVFEKYMNGMKASTPHITFSCTKSFVGLLALIAIEEGYVSGTTSIVEILPELEGSA